MDYNALLNVAWQSLGLEDLQSYAATLQTATADLRDVRGAVAAKLEQLRAAEFFNSLPEAQRSALAHVLGVQGIASAEAVGTPEA